MRSNKLQNFCRAKQTIISDSELATNRMGENFCNLPICQRANIQNLKRTKTDLQEKNKQPHSKVGKGYEQTLFKRRHICGQQAYEKNLNVIDHYRHAHESHMREYLTHVRMAIIKKSGDNRCWRECGEIGTLLHCLW